MNAAGQITVTPDASYTTFPAYDEGTGVLSTATCPANTVVARMGGDTFLGMGVPWASTVALDCRPLTFSPTGEIRVNNAAATTTTVVAGVDENNNGNAFAGPFCGSASGATLSNADDTPGGTAPNQSIDDEDGVGSFAPIIAGGTDTVSVNVTVTNRNPTLPATLVGWIDLNKNGTFQAAEGVSVVIPPLTDTKTSTLTWTGVAAQTIGTSGDTFARFRIADGAALTTSTPTGDGVTGEVEDYRLPITSAAPGLTMVKSASPSDAASFVVGRAITYSFVATNTGNVPLTNVTVDETAFTGTGTAPVVSCPAGAASLTPGAQVTCTATYIVTQADVDAGQLSNTATATGASPSGPPIVSAPDSATVTIPPTGLAKTGVALLPQLVYSGLGLLLLGGLMTLVGLCRRRTC